MKRESSRSMRVIRAGAASLILISAMCGCGSEKSRLEKIYQTAAGGVAGQTTPKASINAPPPASARAMTANALREAWYARKITLDSALTLAHERLDERADGPSVTFAGGLLDMIRTIEPEIEREKVNDLFWIRVGTLAGGAAAKAFNDGDIPLASSLMLGGTDHWQTDAYWRRHTAHDALVAYVMSREGKGKDALDRLRSRPELDEETQRAYDEIERAVRKARGG